MNKKEQKRLMVPKPGDSRRDAARIAAEVLGLSLRQVRRLLAAYKKEGAAALAHGNRGKKPQHALNPELKEKVVRLAQSTYAGCNHQHFTELLSEREGTTIPPEGFNLGEVFCFKYQRTVGRDNVVRFGEHRI